MNRRDALKVVAAIPFGQAATSGMWTFTEPQNPRPFIVDMTNCLYVAVRVGQDEVRISPAELLEALKHD